MIPSVGSPSQDSVGVSSLESPEQHDTQEIAKRVLLSPPPLFPIDDRSTRSFQFSPGPMMVENFDPASGELEAQFLVEGQAEELFKRMATAYAHTENYAFARHFEKESGGKFNDVEVLSWLKAALTKTKENLELERGDAKEEWQKWEELSAEFAKYSHDLEVVDKKLGKQKKKYEKLVAELKKNFLSKDFSADSFLKTLLEVRRLYPSSFVPFYFTLFFSRGMTERDMTPGLISSAYKLSPLLTFNVLMTLFMRGPTSALDGKDEKNFARFAALFLKQFPHDVFGYMLHNVMNRCKSGLLPDASNAEALCRKYFSQNLASALHSVWKRDFEAAYEQFSTAGHYHISDKRPHMYKALIDLREGDTRSAVLQIINLENVIDWSDPDARDNSWENLHQLLKGKAVRPKNHQIETPLLKALLKFYNSSVDKEVAKERRLQRFSAFHEALQSYLKEPEADLLWADFAFDIASHFVSEDFEEREIRGSICHSHEAFVGSAARELYAAGEDLSEYADWFEIEDGKIPYMRAPLIVTTDRKELLDFSIIEGNFLLKKEEQVQLAHEILWKKCNSFSLFWVKIGGGKIDGFLNLLDGLKGSSIPGDSRFFSTILKRFDEEASLKQRTRLLIWANNNREVWPESLRLSLAESACRWQLTEYVTTKNIEGLRQAGTAWVEFVCSENEELEDSALVTALRAWNCFCRQEWREAQKLVFPFLCNWESQLEEGVDPVALRTICLVSTLCESVSIAKAIPQNVKSQTEAELVNQALSILARDGTMQPSVIPHVRISNHKLRELCSLFVGQHRGESDSDYLKRLEKEQIPDFSDLREARNMEDPFASPPDEKYWSFSSLHPLEVETVRGFMREEIAYFKARASHNASIQEEAPEYSQNQDFIDWVEARPNLPARFLANPDLVWKEFDLAFPNFSERASFEADLKKKAGHEEDFREVKRAVLKPCTDSGKRLWQLVGEVAKFVDRVQKSKRSEESYGFFVQSQQEAHFVMQLLWDWGRSRSRGDPHRKFVKDFHGPEVHIWGNGPRINHFNARVFCKNGISKPCHIFFEE